jgi:outer membrane biosynthesis protein TonB
VKKLPGCGLPCKFYCAGETLQLSSRRDVERAARSARAWKLVQDPRAEPSRAEHEPERLAPSPSSQPEQPARATSPSNQPSNQREQPAQATSTSSQSEQPAPATSTSNQSEQPAPATSTSNQPQQPAPATSASNQPQQPARAASPSNEPERLVALTAWPPIRITGRHTTKSQPDGVMSCGPQHAARPTTDGVVGVAWRQRESGRPPPRTGDGLLTDAGIRRCGGCASTGSGR